MHEDSLEKNQLAPVLFGLVILCFVAQLLLIFPSLLSLILFVLQSSELLIQSILE